MKYFLYIYVSLMMKLVYSTPYNFYCSFDKESFCGMIQDPTSDNFNWILGFGVTETPDTGPDKAQEGKYYMLIEASWPRVEGDNAVITFPPVEKDGSYELTFYYYMYGKDIGKLNVYKKSKNGFHTLLQKGGEQGEQWLEQSLEVNLETDESVAIEGVRGSWNKGDIAVDSMWFREKTVTKKPEIINDLEISEYLECPGYSAYRATEGTCDLCAKGSFVDDEIKVCRKCPAGKSTAKAGLLTSKECLKSCYKGTYSDGGDICKKCPEKTTTASDGIHQKADCNITVCSDGQYPASFRNCLPCPHGKTTLNRIKHHSKDDCTFSLVCARHQYIHATTNLCTDCPDGTYTVYRHFENEHSCKKRCPKGHGVAKNMNNGMECTKCRADQVGNGIDCFRPCPAGYYYSDRGVQCLKCSMGTWNDKNDASKCKKCPNDGDFSWPGADSTTKCCPVGEKWDHVNKRCIKCPFGTFRDVAQITSGYTCSKCLDKFGWDKPALSGEPTDDKYIGAKTREECESKILLYNVLS